PAPTWVDVTQYVELDHGVSITRGRGDEFSDAQQNTLTLTLDNRDGRFTPARSGSPYFPNVKKGRRIRVRAVHNEVTYDRFSGYVDEWPVQWPGGGDTRSLVSVSASSRLARLGKGTELRSIVESEYLSDSPVAYYPLGEPAGATSAGNVSRTNQDPLVVTQKGAGGTLTFGTATGPGTDDLTAPTFTRADAFNGKYLTAPLASVADASFMQVEAFFNTTMTVEVGQRPVIVAANSGSLHLELMVDDTEKLAGFAIGTDMEASVLSAGTVNDGLTHHAALKLDTAASPMVLRLYLDGVLADSQNAAGSPGARPPFTRLYVGGDDRGNAPFNGVIAHPVLYFGAEVSAAQIAAHRDSGVTAFSGESSNARITRLARYAGIPTAEISTETGLSTSIAVQVTNDKTPLALMREVEETENGLLFDAGNGTLTFHARSHRYGTTSSLTLSAATGEL
ncbi:MAG: LamG-like jellyroll fold domain-containing protein, partial [Micromonosporaceae bacterium]